MSELRTLSNAVAMVRLLQDQSPLGVTHLASELEISRSAAHRIAVTLLSEGVLTQIPRTRKYALADGVALNAVDREIERCTAIATSPLSALRDATTATVHLAVLAGVRVTFVLGYEPDTELRVSSRVGRSAALHTSAGGKMLLARFSDEQVTQMLDGRQFESLTPNSITSTPALLSELAHVRAQGYATNVAETEIGLYSLAVPIEGAAGHAIATIVISAPIARMGGAGTAPFTFAREPELLREARSAARHVTVQLISESTSR